MHGKPEQRVVTAISLFLIAVFMSGCSLLFGGRGAEGVPTPQPEERAVVPTFTPTPELPPTEVPVPTAEAPTVVEIVPTVEEDSAPAEVEVAPTEAAPSPTAVPKVVVSAAAANVRSGPGTEYGLAGAVNQGQAFDIVGKNAAGTWWQFCCVNGQQAWVFGELVSVENADSVPVAQSIPPTPAPVAAVPAPVVAAPEAPAPTAVPAAPVEEDPVEEAPTEVPEAAPPAPSGGAVNAGQCDDGDGCKFRITGGPNPSPNSGGELKFQLFFIHGGVDGGQPQGDYRLGIEKDGQLISTFANTTSRSLEKNQGSLGPYNYEAKVSASDLPGGTLEGNYFFWVLDGNRERDSQVFELYIPAGQGEVWIQFDQG